MWSVMIPVHDCAGYLRLALPEVLTQLGDRVVVDDASSDDPRAVVEELGRGRVRFVANPTQLRAVRTFNRCIDLAHGELVHLLHGDDQVLPGFYEAMESAMSEPDVLAAVSRALYIDALGQPGPTTRVYRSGTGRWGNALRTQAISNRIRPPAVVVRRSAYLRFGGFRHDLPHAADWEMWTRLAAAGPIVFVDEVLACYRRHDASDTASRVRTGSNIRERVTAIGMLMSHLPRHRRPLDSRVALLFSAVFATRTAWWMVRGRELAAGRRQAYEAVRCLAMVPGGVRTVVLDDPPPVVTRKPALAEQRAT